MSPASVLLALGALLIVCGLAAIAIHGGVDPVEHNGHRCTQIAAHTWKCP